MVDVPGGTELRPLKKFSSEEHGGRFTARTEEALARGRLGPGWKPSARLRRALGTAMDEVKGQGLGAPLHGPTD